MLENRFEIPIPFIERYRIKISEIICSVYPSETIWSIAETFWSHTTVSTVIYIFTGTNYPQTGSKRPRVKMSRFRMSCLSFYFSRFISNWLMYKTESLLPFAVQNVTGKKPCVWKITDIAAVYSVWKVESFFLNFSNLEARRSRRDTVVCAVLRISGLRKSVFPSWIVLVCVYIYIYRT